MKTRINKLERLRKLFSETKTLMRADGCVHQALISFTEMAEAIFEYIEEFRNELKEIQ
jgi:hypothetical protein